MKIYAAKALFMGAAFAAFVCVACEPSRPARTAQTSDDVAAIGSCGFLRKALEMPPECAALLDRLDQGCSAGNKRKCSGALHVRAIDQWMTCTRKRIDAFKNEATVDDVKTACEQSVALADAACHGGFPEDREIVKVAKQELNQPGLAQLQANMRSVQAAKACGEVSIKDCQEGCDAGDLDKCVEIGRMYSEGRRVPADAGKGAGILLSACSKGSVRACYLHGANSLVTDPQAAAASLNIVCAVKDDPFQRPSCGMLVTMIDKGWYAPSRGDRVALFQRICEWERANPSSPGSIGACGRLKDLGEN